MIKAYLNLPMFNAICAGLTEEEAEPIAKAFPKIFREAIEFDSGQEPTKPDLAKTHPKPRPLVDIEDMKERAIGAVQNDPGRRSEEIADELKCDRDVMKRVLDKLVDEKKLYHDGGTRRAKRYLPKPASNGAAEGASA